MNKEDIFTMPSEKATPVDPDDLEFAEEVVAESNLRHLDLLRETIRSILARTPR